MITQEQPFGIYSLKKNNDIHLLYARPSDADCISSAFHISHMERSSDTADDAVCQRERERESERKRERKREREKEREREREREGGGGEGGPDTVPSTTAACTNEKTRLEILYTASHRIMMRSDFFYRVDTSAPRIYSRVKRRQNSSINKEKSYRNLEPNRICTATCNH